jgi:mutator protein MutT
MTIFAAGTLLLTPDNRALLLKRSDNADHPGEWCFPGGGIEPGETAEQAAAREVTEEIGAQSYASPTLLTRQVTPNAQGDLQAL